MIYCDMDGVLVNFRKAVSAKVGMDITSKEFEDLGQAKRNKYYSAICDSVEFWSQLEPMPDYDNLWGYIRYWNPCILTAYPMWGKEAIDVAIKGKQIWNRSHMMVPENRFHVVARVEKQKFALNIHGANVLIDDKDKNIDEWQAVGGIGILHTSAAQTIIQLRNLGFTK
jgi:5' nucleotidase, deoxy (Pyrimidine), cytosolic type C protein (NT5C)